MNNSRRVVSGKNKQSSKKIDSRDRQLDGLPKRQNEKAAVRRE
jgi:hypothetical protein